MLETQEFLQVDFKLPNHSNELCKAEDLIAKLKTKVETHAANKSITNKLHDYLYNEVVRVLDYVGRLSMPAFAIEDELEQMYILKFQKQPAMAKKLWLDHYEQIHHPYNLLKNRCFRLLEDLDQMYIERFSKNPPNWNI